MSPQPLTIRTDLEISAIGRWLHRGWQDFLAVPLPSLAFSAVFCLIGALLLLLLLRAGLGLVFFVLAGGFLLVAPLLASGYYRAAQLLRQGGKPGFGNILRGLLGAPAPVWVIGIVSAALFLIWITDALIVYTVYFDLAQEVALAELANDPSIRGNTLGFLFFSGLLGAGIAFILYAVAAFSIPFAFEHRGGLVEAVVFSVKAIFRNFRVMIAWGLTLAVLTFGVLLIALPLILVVLPVMAYGSFAAYEEVAGAPEGPSRSPQ